MNNNIQFVEKKQVQKILKLVVCLPGSNFSSSFLIQWSEFLQHSFRNNIQVMLSPAEGSVVYYVRAKCLHGDVLRGVEQKPFDGKVDYDYILWIDSDVIFSFEGFIKLLNHQKDIISGAYLMEGANLYAIVENWVEEYFVKNGSFKFVTREDLNKKKELFEVAYAGMGFMLVKRGVFESLSYPWFKPLTLRPAEGIEDFCSEDTSFCLRIRELGYKIFVDPTVRVGHEKRIILIDNV